MFIEEDIETRSVLFDFLAEARFPSLLLKLHFLQMCMLYQDFASMSILKVSAFKRKGNDTSHLHS